MLNLKEKMKDIQGSLITLYFKNHLRRPQNYTTVCRAEFSPCTLSRRFANVSLHYAGQEGYQVTSHDSRDLREEKGLEEEEPSKGT